MAKTILKYLVTLLIGVLLLWYFIHQQSKENIEKAKHAFVIADYYWVGLTILIALFEKVIRAKRWNILMEPLGKTPPLKNTFIAVMVAYLANIFAPRMGEVSRCAILNKTDDIQLSKSFGTVVTERIIDFVCLLILIAVCLLIEYDKIMDLLKTAILSKMTFLQSTSQQWKVLLIGVSILGIVFFVIYLFRKKIQNSALFIKIKEFGFGIWQGVLSIGKMEKKVEFFLYTFLIWICYFTMTYFAFWALPATSHLGLVAGLVILVVGGLGMSVPVQAGIGAFHFIVSQTLSDIYKIDQGEAVSYAFLVHESQTLTVLIGGLICLAFVPSISKKSKTLETKNSASSFI